jgi:NADH-quinone oxidoreductase subunit M
MNDLLWILLVVPLGGAAIVALLGPHRTGAVRSVSLAATIICVVIALTLAVAFASERQETAPPETATEPMTFHPSYATRFVLLPLGPGAIDFYIGLDGLNVWLVVLTAMLMVSSVLASWDSPQVRERTNEYFAWLLMLELGMLGLFLAFDIVLFYVFFELTLVPLFFLIGIWGGPERRYAARKFFIYTLAGSLITLLGLLGVVVFCFLQDNRLTFAIPELVTIVNRLVAREGAAANGYLVFQFWVFLAMAAGFAVKVPLVPLHTWLPLAHVEAPTAGSVLLAGVLLKIGAYGFLRLCLPLAPDASLSVGVPLIGALAVVGIIYGAACALAQEDIKKLVAYSSVSHLGFCMLGMFALNVAGLSGALLQMINHGLSTGALFLLVGMLYDRYHTRQIGDFGGLAARLRLLACFMVFICLTSIGLPGLNGFIGEVLVLLGMYDFKPMLATAASAGIVLGAWYLLRLLLHVFFGPVKEPAHEGRVPDLNFRELATLLPIAIACVFIGVYPQPLLQTSRRDIDVVAHIVQLAKDRPASGDILSRALEPGENPLVEEVAATAWKPLNDDIDSRQGHGQGAKLQ